MNKSKDQKTKKPRTWNEAIVEASNTYDGTNYVYDGADDTIMTESEMLKKFTAQEKYEMLKKVANNQEKKEFRDIEQMESVVKEYITYTKEYNSWVQGIIEDDRNKVFAEIPIDKDGYITTGDYATAQVKINELQYEIYPLPEPPLYKIEVQSESPHFRKVDDYDVVNLVYLDDEFLFKQLQNYKDIDQFCIAVNLLMFEHIQRMVKVAKDNNDWNKDNIYYLPNKEFVRYFQD